jgi:hypothetical protein
VDTPGCMVHFVVIACFSISSINLISIYSTRTHFHNRVISLPCVRGSVCSQALLTQAETLCYLRSVPTSAIKTLLRNESIGVINRSLCAQQKHERSVGSLFSFRRVPYPRSSSGFL